MHREIARRLVESVAGRSGLERHQHPELASGMDVAADVAGLDLEALYAFDDDVLPEGADRLLEQVRHALAVRVRRLEGLRGRGLRIARRGCGERGREGLEFVGPRDEVGLAAELHDRAAASLGGHRDGALGRIATRTLVGLGEAALAEHVDRLLEVAVGLRQGLLAVHHPRAGAVAELLHRCCCNRCHLVPLFRRARGVAVAPSSASSRSPRSVFRVSCRPGRLRRAPGPLHRPPRRRCGSRRVRSVGRSRRVRRGAARVG